VQNLEHEKRYIQSEIDNVTFKRFHVRRDAQKRYGKRHSNYRRKINSIGTVKHKQITRTAL
jgi:hypothetical protein